MDSQLQLQSQPSTHPSSLSSQGLIMWINIALNEGFFPLKLGLMKILTLVSQNIASALKNHIEQNCWFDLLGGKRITYYTPINQKQVAKIDEILPSAINVVFHDTFNDLITFLPQTVTNLRLGIYFNKPLDFPLPSLKFLTFGKRYNHSVDILQFSPDLLKLEFGWDYNTPTNCLPSKLSHLTFSVCYNQPILSLPQSLIHLKFNNDFNKPLDHLLPPKLHFLYLGFNYNHSVDHLPINLKSIEFGFCYNLPVDRLPPKLKKISFGWEFTQPINNLPLNVTHIKFGPQYNIYIKRLPHNVQQVVFGESYRQPIDHLSSKIQFLVDSFRFGLHSSKAYTYTPQK